MVRHSLDRYYPREAEAAEPVGIGDLIGSTLPRDLSARPDLVLAAKIDRYRQVGCDFSGQRTDHRQVPTHRLLPSSPRVMLYAGARENQNSILYSGHGRNLHVSPSLEKVPSRTRRTFQPGVFLIGAQVWYTVLLQNVI